MLMVAPATTLPCGSVTIPDSPDAACATGVPKTETASSAKIWYSDFMTVSSSERHSRHAPRAFSITAFESQAPGSGVRSPALTPERAEPPTPADIFLRRPGRQAVERSRPHGGTF